MPQLMPGIDETASNGRSNWREGLKKFALTAEKFFDIIIDQPYNQ